MLPAMKNWICEICPAVNPDEVEPAKIRPAVPAVPPKVPSHPEMVNILPLVQEAALLFAKETLCAPEPKVRLALSLRVRVLDPVTLKPVVGPVFKVPPFPLKVYAAPLIALAKVAVPAVFVLDTEPVVLKPAML